MPYRKRVNPNTVTAARHYRKHPTPSEARLWQAIRRDRLGVRFRRQVIILGWIVDFYCARAQLIVEVDGGSHRARTREDHYRDATMLRYGSAPCASQRRWS